MTTAQEKLELLQERSKKIIEGAIQINTKIEAAKENHERLEKQAKEKYGTSNLEELEKMLMLWEEENKTQLEEYEQSINTLEKDVTEKSNLIKSIQQSAS